MKKLKSLLTVLVILVLATAIVGGCGSTPAENNQQTGTGDENKSIVLKVGATPVPHAELLAEVKDDLAAEGITSVSYTHLDVYKRQCYMCAKMRRGALYSKAQELGCNKLALGHHFNDVIETTMMNILYTGCFKTMLPKLKSTNFKGLELIRPMYYIEEK